MTHSTLHLSRLSTFTDAKMSSPRARLEITESETSAPRLAFDDEEITTSFSKRARKEFLDDNPKRG
jgi:hypothetical protein